MRLLIRSLYRMGFLFRFSFKLLFFCLFPLFFQSFTLPLQRNTTLYIMEISLNTTNNYWSILKFLSSDMKLELIAKLTNSLLSRNKKAKEIDASQFYGMLSRNKKAKEIDASQFYGTWKDADFPMDADEMVNEIKESRKFKNDIEAF